MNTTHLTRTLAVLAALSLTTRLAPAQSTWTGGSGVDLNWSTPANWSPLAVPGAADAVQFLDTGATNDAVSINNIVSANATVQSVLIAPTNGTTTNPEAFNTLIRPGVTLSVIGTNGNPAIYRVGTPSDVAVTTTVTNTVTGPGGALLLSNPSSQLIVTEGNASSGAHMATLDLSGLDAFSADLGSIQVGVGNSSYRRTMGTLSLARTNTITVRGSEGSPGIFVGDNSGNNNGNGSISYIFLGQQNDVGADYIRVGGQKQQGQMSFNAGLTSPTLALHGSGGGTNRVAYIGIGDEHHQSSSGNPTTGRLDLSGGTANILADTMYVGRSQSGSGASADGYLTMNGGTLDVNTLEIGYEDTAGSTRSYTVAGTATFNGTTVVVNDLLRLGRDGGATPPQDATLNLNGGSVQVNGAFTVEGVATVKVSGGGRLNLPPGSALLASAVTVDGGTISNVNVLQATNSLSIVNGGVITSPTVFDMGGSGLATWDVSSLPAGVTASNQFSGAGSFSGNLTMPPGSVLIPGELGGVNALNLNNNLTLNGATLRLDLSNTGLGGNDAVYVFGNLTLGATNGVRISALNGTLDTANPYTFMNYYGTLTGSANDFQVIGSIAQSRYTFAFSTSTANSIQLLVGGSGAANLLWAGDSLTNTWDLKSTMDWKNNGNPDKFYNLDNVTFDDTGSASPAVNLAGALVPGSMVMSNNTKAYVFAGSGTIAGGSLTNYGSAGLTIRNDGTNNFTMIDIENGNVTLAGGSANICAAAGLVVNNSSGIGTVSATIANTNVNDFGTAGVVLNNGVLIFDQAVDATLASPISGYGTVIKTNTNTLTLSGNNTGFSAPILVAQGTLKAGSGNLIGLGGLIITNGGALDVNAQDLHLLTVTASGAGPDGAGAIINSGPQEIYAFGNVVLAGDTTFGGSGRWDIRSGSDGLSVNGMGYNITKVGPNQVALVGTTVDPTLGNLDVQEGQFSIQTSTISHGGFGDPTKTITVHSNALFETWGLGGDASPLNKVIVLQDGAMIQNDSSASTISGPVTLQGNATFVANALFTFNNVLAGTGGLTASGDSTLLLSGANTYSGATVVSNGTLQVDGSIAGSGVDIAGGTLAGTGSIAAPVTVEINGTLAPGDNAIGALRVANTVSLAGTNLMDVDDTAGVLTSDLISNVTTLTLGGTLQLNITGDTALAAGNSFHLYAANTIAGSFASIIPPTPGPGLAWDTSQLSSGILKVAVALVKPTIGAITISNGNAVLTGSGGPVNGSYSILTTTNISLPYSSWTPVATNQFDSSGNFSFTNSVGTDPQRFYLIQLQ